MAKEVMVNKVLDDEQLSTVAGGNRVERDELSRIMFYDAKIVLCSIHQLNISKVDDCCLSSDACFA